MGNSLKQSNLTKIDYSAALDFNLFKGADFRDYCFAKVDLLSIVSASWLLFPRVYQYGNLCLLRETSEHEVFEMSSRGLLAHEIELACNSFHILDEFAHTGSEFDLKLADECCTIVLRTWEMFLPSQVGKPLTFRRTTFDESYGPTVSFHTQKHDDCDL